MTDDVTNRQRAEWVRQGLTKFGTATRQIKNGKLDDSWETIVGDFLGDLMHFCDRYEIDFEQVLEAGRLHHDFEVDEEAQG